MTWQSYEIVACLVALALGLFSFLTGFIVKRTPPALRVLSLFTLGLYLGSISLLAISLASGQEFPDFALLFLAVIAFIVVMLFGLILTGYAVRSALGQGKSTMAAVALILGVLPALLFVKGVFLSSGLSQGIWIFAIPLSQLLILIYGLFFAPMGRGEDSSPLLRNQSALRAD